jgi:hypothetical protein
LVAGGAQDELFGVFLSGEHMFHTVMASADGDNWSGFFIDDIRFEVDIASATDATNHRPPLGSIVIRPNGAFLVAVAGERATLRRRVELRLGELGPDASDRKGVAFTRWSVVTGKGENKTALWANEVQGVVDRS